MISDGDSDDDGAAALLPATPARVELYVRNKTDEYVATLRAANTAISGEDAPSAKRKILFRALDRAASPMLDAMLLNELSLDLSDEELQRGASLPLAIKEHIGTLLVLLKGDENFDEGSTLYGELQAMIGEATEYLKLAQIDN